MLKIMISNKEIYIKEKIYQESHLWVVEGPKKICRKCGGSGNKKEATKCANCQGTGYQPKTK
jgi:DnaJ-class molecular chaperone